MVNGALPWRICAAAAVAAALAAGCRAAPAGSPSQPRDGRAGLQLTGRIEGRSIAVTQGLPRLETGDCDPNSGGDRDVCFASRTIDGTAFVLVFENPDVLEPGTYDVEARPCPRPTDCDSVTDVAIIDVQLGTGDRIRAVGGTLTVELVEPLQRYRGSVLLDLPDGTLSGDFDVVPRPEIEE
ncbi:MAG: hypothetical protein ACRD0K_11860 [Egibacteraceae bacterium]